MTGIPDEPTCRDVVAFLDAYVEDRVEPRERAAFERHLAACADCVRYLRSYRDTIRLARATADPCDGDTQRIPEDLVEAIVRARRATAGGSPAPPRRRR